MGGNALKNTYTRRYAKNEYYSLSDLMRAKVLSLENLDECCVIEAYKEKDSFGDMDILYTTYDDVPLSVEVIKKMFDPKEIVRNSNVISFDQEEFQIDIIHSPKVEFDYARNYFSFNDCGNLIGRIAKKFGLKHGHNGLRLPLRDGDQEFAEIVLTLDYREALDYLCFDHGKYKEGFNSLEEIFNWVAKNRFYNPEFYKLENLNHTAKIRDRKRSTYNEFLKFGEALQKSDPTKVYWTPSSDRMAYLENVFDYFPKAIDEYKSALRDLAFKRYIKTKFNGEIVSEVSGFVDKELGQFMQFLKKDFWFTPEVLVHLSDEQIRSKISCMVIEFQSER